MTGFRKFITAVMPKLAVDERAVALEIYRGLAASGVTSIAALTERTGVDRSGIEAILSAWQFGETF